MPIGGQGAKSNICIRKVARAKCQIYFFVGILIAIFIQKKVDFMTSKKYGFSILVALFLVGDFSFGREQDLICKLNVGDNVEIINLHIKGTTTVTYNRTGQPELSTFCSSVSNVGHYVCEPIKEDPSFAYFFMNYPWQEMSVVTNGPYMRMRKFESDKQGRVFPCSAPQR